MGNTMRSTISDELLMRFMERMENTVESIKDEVGKLAVTVNITDQKLDNHIVNTQKEIDSVRTISLSKKILWGAIIALMNVITFLITYKYLK